MRVIAAVPAVGLLAGCALGLAVPDRSLIPPLTILALAASVAFAASAAARPHFVVIAVGVAFCAGGAAVSTLAWQRAWRSSLRVAFESIAREQRAEAARRGGRVPEEGGASVVLEGRLTADASPSSSGATSIGLDAEWVGRDAGEHGTGDPAANPVRGRVLLTVMGTLAAERLTEWRAGRRVRVPALLRRPSRYLNPGVPD